MHKAGVVDTVLDTVHSDDVKIQRFSAKILANLAEDPGLLRCEREGVLNLTPASAAAVIRHDLQQTDLAVQIAAIASEDDKVKKELDKALKYLADVQALYCEFIFHGLVN